MFLNRQDRKICRLPVQIIQFVTKVVWRYEYYKVYSKSSDGTGIDKFYKATDATDGSIAFRLTGVVNSHAPWGANDIKTTVTYSFLGSRNVSYATQIEDAATDSGNIAYVADTMGLVTYMDGQVMMFWCQ